MRILGRMKEIEIDCPCCEARLWVDVLTGKVLRHALPDELDEFGKPRRDTGRWDAAQGRVSERKARGTDAFDEALSREKGRARDLDDLFDRARKKVDERKQDLDG